MKAEPFWSTFPKAPFQYEILFYQYRESQYKD